MKNKLLFMLLICLLLVSCKSAKRSDVVDVLIDNGYSRNAAGFYERVDELSYLRIGYKNSIIGYMESLVNNIGPGPLILIDVGNNISYNYHINEDAMLYNVYCTVDNKFLYSEIMYSFVDKVFIVGADDCNFDAENQDPLILVFNEKKSLIISELDRVGLDKKKLALLKE